MPSQSQDALTMLLMQSLTQQGAGMTPGADPFAPGAEGAPEGDTMRRDPFSQAQSVPAAQRLAKGLGVDVSELEQPASGPMAEALGVEGVEPDFDQAEKLIKLMQMSRQMGMQEALGQQGGGPPPADPTTRNALTYQAIQNSVQRFGPGHAGGQILNALSPLLAPYMMGPALERQRAEARQATQLKNAIEIAKTRQLGEKRRFEIEKLKAEADKLKAETREIGKGKNKLTYRTVGNTVRIYDAEGNILRVDQGPDKPEKPYKIDDGESIRSWGSFADFAAGEEPVRTVQKVPPGSAAERKDLADLYTNLTAARKRLRDNFNSKFIGPVIGKAITEMKTGGSALAQYKAQLKLKAYFATDAEMKQAIDYVQDLQQFKADLIMYYSKTQVPQHEEQMRQKHIPYETDLPESFVSALDATDRHIVNSIEHRERVMGRRIRPEFGDEAVKPPGGQFTGDPTTKPSGQLQDRVDQQMINELRNDLGY